ncbi:MAG TPA: DUF3426 domain-containing protein [Rhodocyclaceae bacterium]|nr:DUF3426 domain-containing protein [Rhodocyclaceae bacterium]
MFTRCPTCTTTFRVTPEQLKARLGRVRCGQCQAVFNALDSLVEEASLSVTSMGGPTTAAEASLPVEPPAPAPDIAGDAATADAAFEDQAANDLPEPAVETNLVPEMDAPAATSESSPPSDAAIDTATTAIEAETTDIVPENTENVAQTEDFPLVSEDVTAPADTGQEDALNLLDHGLENVAPEAHQIEAANEPLEPLAEQSPAEPLVTVAETAEISTPLPVDATESATPTDAPTDATEPPSAPTAASEDNGVTITVVPREPLPGIPPLEAVASTEPPATELSPAIQIEVVPTASLQAANDHLLAGVKETIEPVVVRPAESDDEPAPSSTPDLTEIMHQAVPLLHKRPPRRWPWSIGIGLALVALVLQLALLYRVELASMKPGLKPTLQALCRPLGCIVPLPHQIDLLSIETSDLHPLPQKGQLQLIATLKNKATFAQEYPLLEVTLTDVADRSLIVKAIPAADYLPAELKAEAGFPARREINVSLTFDIGDVPAVGYRVYLYHP